ncbi:MAG: HlyD family efflux transporter periplasmic adaptor subunit [Arachidicoccus sp.]|nr:HlyD family efflux transporter periplasmic adaptor subunit [Arachidicoccus sp.]
MNNRFLSFGKTNVLWIVSFFVVFIHLASCKKYDTTSPVRKNIVEAVFANGYLKREDEYDISANAAGTLYGFNLKEGDSIHYKQIVGYINNEAQKNQVIQAQLAYANAVTDAAENSDQLIQLQQQVVQAQAQLAHDKLNYSRYKDLMATNSVSKSDYNNVELQYTNSLHNLEIAEKKYAQTKTDLSYSANSGNAALKQQQSLLNDYNVQADSAGIVIETYKKNGEILKNGDNIALIGSGTYKIILWVSEDDIIKVSLGQKIAVHLNTHSDSAFTATVTKIYPGFNDDQQSYTVEAHFDELPKNLYSGTQLQADISVGYKKNALVIPANYLQKDGTIQLKNGSSKKIVTGYKDDQWVEILSGISENDVIKTPKN